MTTPLNILYHFRTQGLGVEAVHISGIARAFQRLGHTVEFSSPGNVNPLESISKASHYRSSKSFLRSVVDAAPDFLFELFEIAYNFLGLLRNFRIARRFKPNMIYERHAFFLFSTALLAGWLKIPLVVEVNELVGDPRVRGQPLLAVFARLSDRIVFKRATLICVVSTHLKSRIVALGVDPDKVLVLPNGVDEADYAELADGRALRSTHSIEQAEVVVGFVGWFVPWHRMDLLVEVVGRLREKGVPVKLLLVGDGDCRADLEKQVAEAGLDDAVIFTGLVPHTDVAQYIAAMDVCVIPESNEYRSPIKMFEYMGQEKAVVAPDLEPISMVISDGDDGLLFARSNGDEMLDAIKQLSEDADLRHRVSRAAREKVMTQHTWRCNAERILRKTLERVVKTY
ncbi:MAG: glycosyltransferase family 4 protein [Lysobacterales bacterium]